MKRLLVSALLIPSILMLACGGGGGSDEKQVESVLRSYVDYYVSSEPAKMYALLDAGSQERCSEENFVAFISAARDALGQRKFEITAVRNVVIEGESASAIVISTVDAEEADPTANKLVKEDGEWKLKLPSGGC